MRKYVDDKKLVITEIKSFHFHFDLPRNADENLKQDINHVIRHNEFFVQRTKKTKLHKYDNYNLHVA